MRAALLFAVSLICSLSFVQCEEESENAFLGNVFLCDGMYYNNEYPGIFYIYFTKAGGSVQARTVYSMADWFWSDAVSGVSFLTSKVAVADGPGGSLTAFVTGSDQIFVNFIRGDNNELYDAYGKCVLNNEGKKVFDTLYLREFRLTNATSTVE